MYYYQKPSEICSNLPLKFNDFNEKFDEFFIEWYKTNILERTHAENLVIRTAKLSDFDSIVHFVEVHYTRLEGNNLSLYEYYRIIEYGHVVLLEKEEKIIGCIFEIGYNTEEKTSYALRLVLTPSARGRGYAQLLTDYTCYLSILRGSKVIRATIAVTNTVSLFFHLNKVGMIIEAINPPLPGLTRYYQASLPLNPESLFSNRIDHEKLDAYLKKSIAGVDYILHDIREIDQIEAMFLKTDFVIVAFVFKGNKIYQFVALHKNNLQFVTDKIFNGF